MSKGEAFVSLATNDSYATGALALGKSIRDSGSTRRLALMVTSGITEEMRLRLSCVWDELVDVEQLDSGDAEHLQLLARPELGVTFSKINAWRLTQYSKCVFLDADTLVIQNVDELFEREELSAAPDIGWPDCFNSGVFVFEPSLKTFYELIDLSRQTGSFDGGDQGLLNQYWSDWATKDIKYHLPFTFNVTPNVTYGYAPAFQRFGRSIKIVHFIGSIKPWQHRYLPAVDAVILYPGTYAAQNAAHDYIKRWWQVYSSLEESYLPPNIDTGWGNLYHPLEDCHQHCLSSHHHQLFPPHSSLSTQPPPLSPNLGGGSTRNPYHCVGGYLTNYASHSVTPLDSVSQFLARRYPYTSTSDYAHPLNSVSRANSEASFLGSPPLLSPLSHEDVHSHISLSFYSQNGMFERISSLVHTEPRSYYVEDLPDTGEPEDAVYIEHSLSTDGISQDELDSSGSTWSLHHLNPPPSYHTPLSLTNQPHFSILYTPDADPSWGYYSLDSAPFPSVVSTENDDMYVSHDSHVTVLPQAPTEERGVLVSRDFQVTAPVPPLMEEDTVQLLDSVLHIYSSPPIPPISLSTTTHTSSFPLPPSSPTPLAPNHLRGVPQGSHPSTCSSESSIHHTHRREFEVGELYTTGRDSFQNIQAHIDSILNSDKGAEGNSNNAITENQK